MYKFIIFDLDGTLINSIKDIGNSVNKGLEKAGLKTYKIDEYKNFVGNGIEDLFKTTMGNSYEDKNLLNKVRNEFNATYSKYFTEHTVEYKGCSEMLKELKNRNIKVGVLSNKPDKFVKPILEKVFPNFTFAVAWGKKEKYDFKPNPESLNAIIKKMNFNNKECLYVGDSDVDILTGKNARVDAIGVEWGFRSKNELILAGAKTTIKKPTDILKLL